MLDRQKRVLLLSAAQEMRSLSPNLIGELLKGPFRKHSRSLSGRHGNSQKLEPIDITGNMEANSVNGLRLAAALGHQFVLRGKVPVRRLVAAGRRGNIRA
jgi:hypothetical protein